MKEYSHELVERLKAQQDVTNINGIKIVIKNSPEESREGYMDPRELAIMSNHWAARKEAGKDKSREVTPEQSLEAMRDGMGFPNRNLNMVEIHTKYECINFDGNEVGLWRYYTRKSRRKPGKPCFIYLHGGGWVGGSIYTVENPCKLIAELADAVVFNIDYSLAPEKKYPNGFNDCFNAVKHIYEHAEDYGIDRRKIGLGGDSAGGNLTAAVAQKDRDSGLHMLSLQVLIYPCVTFIHTGISGYRWKLEDYVISEEQREIIEPCLSIGRPSEESNKPGMGNLYFNDISEAESPYASPMLTGNLKGLPRALCVGAEFDGLRIQTEHYGRLLEAASVPVKIIRYKGVIHAFIDRLGFVPQAEDLCIEIADALKEMQ